METPHGLNRFARGEAPEWKLFCSAENCHGETFMLFDPRHLTHQSVTLTYGLSLAGSDGPIMMHSPGDNTNRPLLRPVCCAQCYTEYGPDSPWDPSD